MLKLGFCEEVRKCLQQHLFSKQISISSEVVPTVSRDDVRVQELVLTITNVLCNFVAFPGNGERIISSGIISDLATIFEDQMSKNSDLVSNICTLIRNIAIVSTNDARIFLKIQESNFSGLFLITL
jgi:hypothetical protein